MARIKISATFSPDLISRVDAFCSSNSLSRSACFALAVSEWLDAKDKEVAVKKSFADLFSVLYRASSDQLSKEDLVAELDRVQMSFDDLRL